jgi:putative ABC transport system permease protein
MFRNYFRIAFRSLVRNRFSAAINIGGLAIGMSVAILIGLWIHDELSFDKVHDNYDRIASVMQNQVISGHVQTWRSEAMQLAPVLRKDFGADFKCVVTGTGAWEHLLTVGDKKLKYTGSYMEAPVIDMLSLKMLLGNHTALQDPSSIILSASAASGLFGDGDAIGKLVRLDNTHPLTVTGIYADLPANSSFADLHFIAPFPNLVHSEGYDTTLGWGNSWFQTYVQLNAQVDMAKTSASIRNIKADNSPGDRRFKPALFLHPMSRWRLYSDFEEGVSAGGRIRYVRLFAIIGAFVLLLACINFMNLSTARSEKRAKEVGIRKAIGSLRGQLIRQFFSESLVIATLAFALSIGLVQLLLPFFNEVADKKMGIPWGQSLFWLTGLCFTVVTGLLAGSYPALYLSSFRPEKVLKGTFRVGRLAALPRKILVVVQFTVSVILIIGTIAVFHQIQYARDRPAGYSRDGLITVALQSFKVNPHLEALRRDLLQSGFVEGIAGSESSPANTWITNSGFDWPGKDPSLQEEFTSNGITPEFGKVTGWQIAEGRDFSRDYSTDSTSFLINETAAKYMGLRHPIGQQVKWGNNGRFTIIGVVKDMVAQTPYDPVTPMIFYMSSSLSFSHLGVIDIRLRPGAGTARALAAIGAIFKKYDPEDPFEYRFADEEYAKKFGEEERIGRLAGFFTLLAIIISCLGLLGLSSFVAEQRTREIGVRKILGASVFHLWQLLSREFVGLVGLSLLIGGPIAWWIMKGWLAGYRYHAGLSWWVFALATLGAIGLTLFTVSFQAIRAALANPVKSLRSE